MCTICDLRIEFSVDHPMSLSVAVATRKAVDAGLLSDHTVRGGGFQLRESAIAALRSVQERVEQALPKSEFLALPEFFMLEIESRTWGFFRATVNGFDPNCRPDPPRVTAKDATDRDPAIVVSERALRQVVSGKLPFSKAEEQGLIIIDADTSRRATLRKIWDLAYPSSGFSGFMCN